MRAPFSSPRGNCKQGKVTSHVFSIGKLPHGSNGLSLTSTDVLAARGSSRAPTPRRKELEKRDGGAGLEPERLLSQMGEPVGFKRLNQNDKYLHLRRFDKLLTDLIHAIKVLLCGRVGRLKRPIVDGPLPDIEKAADVFHGDKARLQTTKHANVRDLVFEIPGDRFCAFRSRLL